MNRRVAQNRLAVLSDARNKRVMFAASNHLDVCNLKAGLIRAASKSCAATRVHASR